MHRLSNCLREHVIIKRPTLLVHRLTVRGPYYDALLAATFDWQSLGRSLMVFSSQPRIQSVVRHHHWSLESLLISMDALLDSYFGLRLMEGAEIASRTSPRHHFSPSIRPKPPTDNVSQGVATFDLPCVIRYMIHLLRCPLEV